MPQHRVVPPDLPPCQAAAAALHGQEQADVAEGDLRVRRALTHHSRSKQHGWNPGLTCRAIPRWLGALGKAGARGTAAHTNSSCATPHGLVGTGQVEKAVESRGKQTWMEHNARVPGWRMRRT